MKRFIICSSFYLLITSSCSLLAEDENTLMEETSMFVKLAKQAEQESYEQSYKYCLEALTYAGKILSDFSQTELCQKLSRGEIKIENITWQEFIEEFAPRIKLKFQAETDILECARYLAASCIDVEEKSELLCQIAVVYSKCSLKKEAINSLREAIELSVKNKKSRDRTLPRIIRSFLEIGEYETANDLIKTLENNDSINAKELYVDMTVSYAKSGMFDEAIKLANSLDVLSNKCIALAMISKEYSGKNQNRAVELLAQAEVLSSTLENGFKQQIAIGEIAKAFAKMGDFQKALLLVQKINNADVTEGADIKALTMAEIGLDYIYHNQDDKGLELIKEIADAFAREWCLSAIALYYAENQQMDKALDIFNSLKEDISRSIAIVSLCSIYVKNAEYDKALDLINKNPVSHDVKAFVVVKISYACFVNGNEDKSIEFLLQSLQETQKIENIVDKVISLTRIAEQYPEVNKKLNSKCKQILHKIIQDTSNKKESLLSPALQIQGMIYTKKNEQGYNEYTQDKTGMLFVQIPAGQFRMGSNDGNSDEEPVHEVTLKSFLISKYEVTQEVWENVMGDNPSNYNGKQNPVENISWNDCQKFCEKVNLRLPTEAEWEYACRAGTNTAYFWGNKMDEDYLWYYANSEKTTHPVGQKKPNGYGLYDMSGNVWEWCQDWYRGDYYANSPNSNPQGPESGELRVRRGGSWDCTPSYARVANRVINIPGYVFPLYGFRCVQDIN